MRTPIQLARSLLAVAAALVMLTTAGCVSTIVEPETEATFFMTRAGDTVTISWMSEVDLSYTILYTVERRPGVPWQMSQGGENIRGNGDQITFVEKVPPDEQRYYRVQINPLPKK
ncbi:MAG TPA: hypothetical protein VIH35_01595 [Kiritimatiellia bacterium]|jgi:hypothetical protein